MAPGKTPTIRDVAARARVSAATVSNVLANRATVNAELAARVRSAVRELGYEVDRLAAQLRSGRSRVVAVLVPSLENPFFTSIIASIERQARRGGFEIIVASSSDQEGANDQEDFERARLAALLSWRPLGVVVLPCSDGFANRSALHQAGVPYVVVDRIVEGHSAVDVVGIDNAAAAAQAAEHLVRLGHRDLLISASSLELANVRERCAGIRRVLRDAGLREPALLQGGFTFESVAERLRAWLAHHRRPTAIIALTNFATLGVLSALGSLSLRVPEHLSLVGFDDYAWMRAATPSITAVRQPVDSIGAEAVKLLEARIQGDGGPPRAVRLACELFERASTRRIGPPPGARGARTAPGRGRPTVKAASKAGARKGGAAARVDAGP